MNKTSTNKKSIRKFESFLNSSAEFWNFEKGTVSSLSKEYTKGLFEIYEKDRRVNLLAYKLAGHQTAKKYIDQSGNTKNKIIPETEKLAFLRNRLIEQGGEVPEIKDSLDDEDEFYF